MGRDLRQNGCMNLNKSLLSANLCRWAARIFSLLLASLVLLIAIVEGAPLGAFVVLGLLVISLLAGWRWELPGGLISTAAWGIFLVAVIRSPRGFHPFALVLALPGALYIASALLRRFIKPPGVSAE
jgi:hypothetical protein